MPRTLYRIVRANPPIVDDFMSDAAFGEPPPPDPERARLHDGISTFNTEQQARRKAQAYPILGSYLATIVLPDDAPARVERTLGSRGHQTVWADPAYLLAHVMSIAPVEPLS